MEEDDSKSVVPQRHYTKLLRTRTIKQVPYKVKNKLKQKAKGSAKYVNRSLNTYYFKRKALGNAVSMASPNFTYQFTLSSLDNVSEFTNMFDQYMIQGVKIGWRLVFTPDGLPSSAASYPNLYVRVDYDNTTAETVNQIIQDNKSKRFILSPNKLATMYITPSTLRKMEGFNGSTINQPQWKQWIDCSDNAVPHLGVKCAVDTMGVDLSQYRIQTEYTYYLAFKNTR